jgi:hypothetical protein
MGTIPWQKPPFKRFREILLPRRDRVARAMQPPSCQHDDLACLPRSQTGPRCRRGPSASGKSAVVNAPGMAPGMRQGDGYEVLIDGRRKMSIPFWLQTGPRCRRGPSASGRQHRAASRCSSRMVSPVPSARFDATAITYARKSAVVNAAGMAPLNTAASAGESLVRQERDFWMRRPGPQNRRKRQRTSAETKTAQNR